MIAGEAMNGASNRWITGVRMLAAEHHPANDLRRGLAAFSYASNDYNNFEYRDTSLLKAAEFVDYLAVGDFF
jgi:hypothetical protein